MEKTAKEEKLVRLAMSGDVDAFCQLYESYRLRLYRYAYYRLGDQADAEDAVSECFLSAWKRISFLRSEKAFGGWIFKILSGHCAGLIKSQIERKDQVSLDGSADGDAKAMSAGSGAVTCDDLDDRISDRIQLQEALSQLSPEDREIVLLSVVGGFKSREIGEITGLRPGSVRSRLSRALAKMREYLLETEGMDRRAADATDIKGE